jgi:hypothetical protein
MTFLPIHPEGKSSSDLGQVLAFIDPPPRCSSAPQLYVDEMLYRAKTGNIKVDTPLCAADAANPRWNHGAAWSAADTCPPWLKMHKLCGGA